MNSIPLFSFAQVAGRVCHEGAAAPKARKNAASRESLAPVLRLFLTCLRPVVRSPPKEDGLAIDGIGDGGVWLSTPGDGSLDHRLIQRRAAHGAERAQL